jgi:hypothetical protein
MTPKPKKKFVPATFNKFNVDKASEAGYLTAENKNQAALMRGSVNIAENQAANIQSLGQAAALGNKFMDTSAASGFQNRGTAQYTSLLKGQIVDPVKAQQQGLLATIKLRNKKKYQEALAERARMGGGTSDTPVPTMSTNTQEIL